jgi:FkbM family methyltransferase
MIANPPRTLGFVLAATEHGTMILNRFDQHDAGAGAYGVGYNLLHLAHYDPIEVANAVSLPAIRRGHFGDGVVAVDCGANIGVHTLAWARSMTGWGSMIAIEAQERVFYALAGNLALNNCFNARALFAAAAAADGSMRIPTPDYLALGSFGSLELQRADNNEFIGQTIDWREDRLTEIRTMAIDSLGLARLDLLKIDVEGMELQVLAGAAQTIARCRPIVIVEHLKTDRTALTADLESHGYRVLRQDLNMIAIHPTDPSLEQIVVVEC